MDSGGTHVWWRQEPSLGGYPHTPGGIAAPRRSHGWSVHQNGSHHPTHGQLVDESHTDGQELHREELTVVERLHQTREDMTSAVPTPGRAPTLR